MESHDGETCIRRAYDAIFQGDFETAADWFRQAIDKDPDNASYYYKASITCARSGKMGLAATYAKRAAELDPEDPVFALNVQAIEARRLTAEARALLESRSPDMDRADALLREAETLDPLSAEAKLLLALVSRMSGRLRDAIDFLQDTLQLEPQHEEAKRLLREARAQLRRFVRQQLSPHQPNGNR